MPSLDKPPSPKSTTPSVSVSPSSSTNPSRSTTPKPLRESSTPTPTPTTSTSTSTSTNTSKPLLPRRAPSATNSPIPSREASPVRPTPKQTISTRSTAPAASRSRKNSAHDVSPSRASSTTNPPSAAATQRALSAASIPALYPTGSETIIRAPIPQKPSVPSELKDPPRWPVSPGLRSPPPIVKPTILSPRKTEHDRPSINAQRTLPPTEHSEGKPGPNDREADDTLVVPGMRTPARGASGASSMLETVQEISPPKGRPGDPVEKGESESGRSASDQDTTPTATKSKNSGSSMAANESGSESGGKGEIKMRTTSAAPGTASRLSAPAVKSFGAGAGAGRGKVPAEGSTRNMTVEAEVVTSLPQLPVGGPGGNGSIRPKPSSETIRPRKEKKKTTRKTPSVTSGTASSKADIFEAKVASAVDEADSSDSEETFVYESNPPEPVDRPRRYHSRTPSATSMASQVDQRNAPRSAIEAGHSVAMKKSMKFANSFTSNGPDSTTGEDDGKGTARSNLGTGRGTSHHHHHIGRWGRNGGNGHASLFDTESPFPHAAKSKIPGGAGRQSSQPTSPRPSNPRAGGFGKRNSPIPSAYDLDDGADDERTPLLATVRPGRSGRVRRPNPASLRQLEHQARHDGSFFSQCAGWLVLSLMILLVVTGAVGFMFATTQPLSEVRVLALKNVLASEQDIIFDMKVQARNPNIVAVTLDMADLVVFAKSKYAGTDSEWWRQPGLSTMRRALFRTRDDDPDDPPTGDDPNTNPNLEIGHVYELDSPLSFEGSPFHHTRSISTGQIRVDHPGNQTVPSGSERWGRVLQHEFDLLVRGTLKYSLPLSQKTRSLSVEGRITVKPNAADSDPDAVHIIEDPSAGPPPSG